MRGAVHLLLVAALASAVCAAGSADAGANQCRPRKAKPAITLTNMGPCAFEPERMSFAGDPVTQARCLVRPVGVLARLGPIPDALPPVLADRVGRFALMPSRKAVTAVLTEMGLDTQFAESLYAPVSRAQDGDPFGRARAISSSTTPAVRVCRGLATVSTPAGSTICAISTAATAGRSPTR